MWCKIDKEGRAVWCLLCMCQCVCACVSVWGHVYFCLNCMFMHAFVYLVNLSFGGLPQVVSDGKVCEPLSWQHSHLQKCGQTVREELTEHNGCFC